MHPLNSPKKSVITESRFPADIVRSGVGGFTALFRDFGFQITKLKQIQYGDAGQLGKLSHAPWL
jgi:hypothetical protein